MPARIYLVTNNINGKQYVGQTITQHSRHGHGHALRDAYKKHGFKNFTYDVVVSGIDKDSLFLDYAEKFWIEVIGSLAPNGYNLEAGGKRGKIVYHAPQLGKSHSEETRKKMSESQKKHWSSYDVHPNKGRTASEETKAKMRASRAKRVYTEEDKLKISLAVKEWHKKRKEMLCR